jgi:hypothetical protein
MDGRRVPTRVDGIRVMQQFEKFDEFGEVVMADDFTFRFVEFNQRRAARGAPAARIDFGGDWAWMSLLDLRRNIKIYGRLAAFTQAIEAYKNKGR